jgi:hypothetical protein
VGQRPDEITERTTVVRAPHAGEPTIERDLTRGVHRESEATHDDTSAAAREDIELTRAEMSSTIDAIQDKLDPELLSEQAKDTAHDVTDYAIREAKEAAREITDHALLQAREAVRDASGQAKLALREATIGKVEHMAHIATNTAGGWRQGVMDTIRANPMPAAVVGLGVGWMLLNRPSSSSRHASGAQQAVPRVTDRTQAKAGEVVDQVQDTAAGVMDQVQGAANQAVDQVQETGGEIVEQVQLQTSRAQSFLQQQLEEKPLIVGAVAVAVGGVLAGMVRSTPLEDQLLGRAHDQVMQAAQEVTQDTMQKVGRGVDQAQRAAADEASDQELVPGSESSLR